MKYKPTILLKCLLILFSIGLIQSCGYRWIKVSENERIKYFIKPRKQNLVVMYQFDGIQHWRKILVFCSSKKMNQLDSIYMINDGSQLFSAYTDSLGGFNFFNHKIQNGLPNSRSLTTVEQFLVKRLLLQGPFLKLNGSVFNPSMIQGWKEISDPQQRYIIPERIK